MRKLSSLLLIFVLAGCTIFPHPPGSAVIAGSAGSAGAISGGSSGSGYYLDDGPPVGAPEVAIADIPDAIVRSEPINPSRNRPYVALGKRYVPFTSLQPYRKQGIASWYGKRYHGRKTASGELYDMHKMTAAHPVLPIPSYARVTRVSTGKSIIVRINDRGPFLEGREIDLSYVAASKLDIVQAGTGEVVVETILPSGVAPATAASDSGGSISKATAISNAVYIQLAAFKTPGLAQQHISELKTELPSNYHPHLSIHRKENGWQAVQIGPYSNHAAATKDDERLCREYNRCGFLTLRYY